jgi:proteasome lid subunit RPN8/RPN11
LERVTLILSPEILRAIQAHGEGAYPNEGAGFLLGRQSGAAKTVTATMPLENKWDAAGQYHRFELSSQDWLAAEAECDRQGLDWIGCFHSHPDHPAMPSEFDRDHALPWFSYIITSIEGGRAVVSRAWLLADDRSAFAEEEIEAAQ